MSGILCPATGTFGFFEIWGDRWRMYGLQLGSSVLILKACLQKVAVQDRHGEQLLQEERGPLCKRTTIFSGQ
jgi:hypothetical protein